MPERADFRGPTLTIRRSASAGTTAGWSTSGSEKIILGQLFLSSTIEDLSEYRDEVQTKLRRYPNVACFPSEGWLNTYDITVQKCRDEISKAGGYIGIFAYWYGSIPEGYDRSYTHLEFSCALERWKDKSELMIIFMPESRSQAERDLRQKAAGLIPIDQQEQATHSELLSKFHKEVTKDRTVQFFKDQEDLGHWAIAFGAMFRKLLPLYVAQGYLDATDNNPGTRRISEEQWGLLGRKTQLDTVDRILNRLDLHPTVPAVAILAHGNEDAGHRFFLQRLLGKRKLREGRPPEMGRPPFDRYGVQSLIQWVGISLEMPKDLENGSITELAQWIHNELQLQQLCLVLKQVSRLAGGVTAFYNDFWQPLYTSLRQLRERQPVPHRLITIVSDDTDASELPPTVAIDWKTTITAEDFAYLIRLPVLGEITTDDLLEWFDELGVPETVMGDRQSLVNVSLNTASRVDGTFLRVFDRLNQIELLPKGEV